MALSRSWACSRPSAVFGTLLPRKSVHRRIRPHVPNHLTPNVRRSRRAPRTIRFHTGIRYCHVSIASPSRRALAAHLSALGRLRSIQPKEPGATPAARRDCTRTLIIYGRARSAHGHSRCDSHLRHGHRTTGGRDGHRPPWAHNGRRILTRHSRSRRRNRHRRPRQIPDPGAHQHAHAPRRRSTRSDVR